MSAGAPGWFLAINDTRGMMGCAECDASKAIARPPGTRTLARLRKASVMRV